MSWTSWLAMLLLWLSSLDLDDILPLQFPTSLKIECLQHVCGTSPYSLGTRTARCNSYKREPGFLHLLSAFSPSPRQACVQHGCSGESLNLNFYSPIKPSDSNSRVRIFPVPQKHHLDCTCTCTCMSDRGGTPSRLGNVLEGATSV